MRTKTCRLCGLTFESAKSEAVYCPACSPKARAATVIRQRTCKQCGASFPGGPRAWYCPDCRLERRRAADARSKRDGAARPIGSTDLCAICGAEYTVDGPLQKYCKACAEDAVKATVSAHKRIYNAEHQEHLDAIARERKEGIKPCKICGKPIISTQPTVTCSPECAAVLRSRWQHDADAKRRGRKT